MTSKAAEAISPARRLDMAEFPPAKRDQLSPLGPGESNEAIETHGIGQLRGALRLQAGLEE
jgi:hypothetical protein